MIALDARTPVLVFQAAPNLFAHGHLGIARSLGRLGVPVYGMHDDAWAPAAVSRYMRRVFGVPPVGAAPSQMLEHVLRVGRAIGRRSILIPIDDVGSMFVTEHADALREQFIFPDQPAGLPQALSSKKELYFLCKRHGVPTPETFFPESRADVCRFLAQGSVPVAIKSIDSRLLKQRPQARSVVIAHTPAELLELYDRMEVPSQPNLMLQEYIPGGPDSIWMFDGYFDAGSECLLGLSGQKIRQHPPDSGVTTLGICVQNEPVVARTRALLKAVGYRGIVDLGYRYDARDGQYKMLDVNPRIGATFRLFTASNGLDVVRAMYLDLTGQPVPGWSPPEGRRWLVESLDVATSLSYLRQGRLSPAGWARSLRGVAETAWFATDDPAPFGMLCWRLGVRLARRGRAGLGSRRRPPGT